MIRLLDVIWIFDDLIDPPHPKMVVCVSPEDGWFFRINSRPSFRPFVKLSKADHPFLHHDSHLHCETLELDDYLVEEALRRNNGPVGSIAIHLVHEIVRRSNENRRGIPTKERERICSLLEGLL